MLYLYKNKFIILIDNDKNIGHIYTFKLKLDRIDLN